MEYAESSKGMLEKMMTNETLAKMTRSSHFNPKAGGVSTSNGFRSPMLPPHLNGKTISGISSLSQSGSKSSNSEPQPRRSVITLKNAPGPPVNSSGTGVLKTKSCITTVERLGSESKGVGGGRGGRSRKRSREGEVLAAELSNHQDDKKDGSNNGAADQSTSASENVESTRRRRRGQSSKRLDKKNGHLPPVADLSPSKLKVSSNSASATGILDMYGLKSKHVDLSRFMVNITPLDILLSDDREKTQPASADDDGGDGESGLVLKEINNVMQLLPKHTFVQKPFVENALNEDVKVRLMLDLERPSQGDESQQSEDRLHTPGSLDKTKSKSFELFPTFTLEDLPLHSVEDFADRLKLPASDSLDALISFSKPTDHAGPGTEKNSRYEGIPPSPFSFSPCGVSDYSRAARNGRTGERTWPKSESGSKTKVEPTPVKVEVPESRSGAAAVRPKEEQDEEGSLPQRDRGGEFEKSKSAVHPELPSLQLKRDDDDAPHSRRTLSNLPAMPCSPGVQAATILCTMANSDDKEFVVKGKRQQSSEAPHHRTSKLARIDEKPSTQIPDGHGTSRKETASHHHHPPFLGHAALFRASRLAWGRRLWGLGQPSRSSHPRRRGGLRLKGSRDLPSTAAAAVAK
ncbi:hypothetical protein SELMODRAFT_439313 [Selaginella moellendorffii]|uniref:Uncharacterized protein n=1 Tax=Selaginella moellendorffii TaxID=88036 RepID=D8R3I2_SELML|nr:hypothetical protein SELMODRAFT_439313 [Selaginella moellendorffii]